MADTNNKDRWEKLGTLLQSGGGLLTAVTVAILGFIGSNYLKDRESADTASRERMQANEANVRIYTELMSKREESESVLRKGMFDSMIQSFMKSGSGSMDERVLNLELLSYNFHESINLKPLFIFLDKQIRASKEKARGEYLDRVHKVATEITRKQMIVLEGAGRKFDRHIDLDSLAASPGGIPLDEDTLTLETITRHFSLFVQKADRDTRELKVRLEIRTPTDTVGNFELNTVEFWVGFFDFPMIDNTRLANDQRCSVVLNAFEDDSADITLVYFPGSYASLKEKPYYQEVVQKLMRTSAQINQQH
jgi:hypothetical protein